MHGFDHWHAYELSWLNSNGKPIVAVAELFFNADSENIVESKSLKLYLNSLGQEKFNSSAALSDVITNDLSALTKSQVRVDIHGVEQAGSSSPLPARGKSLDNLDVNISTYEPDEGLLVVGDELVFDEEVCSNLFRSNCPVTGAPDWASIEICYTGSRIDESGLLAYLCSFRQHQGYHEECAERIYRDLMVQCAPQELRVAMNYLRRGGIDINVYRSSMPLNSEQANPRTPRQ